MEQKEKKTKEKKVNLSKLCKVSLSRDRISISLLNKNSEGRIISSSYPWPYYESVYNEITRKNDIIRLDRRQIIKKFFLDHGYNENGEYVGKKEDDE